MSKTIIRARAPLRISFGGGGTDVAPYCAERGGLVLNATINRYAYVTIEPNDSGRIKLVSLDFGQEVVYDADSPIPTENDDMKLAKGVIRRLGISGEGFNLYTHTDCPPGSGLGASSTMVVALLGAFNEWKGLSLGTYDIAQLAYDIERIDLGIKGGSQDQYAAAFGGFNLIEFYADHVLVNPLRISDAAIAELEYSLILAFTGKSRFSSSIIETQIRNYEAQNADAIAGMDATKALATEMKAALLKGTYRRLGELLHEAWVAKKKMSDHISNPQIDRLYEAACEAGAVGGKISGAGGGGFMYFFAAFDKRKAVADSIQALGAEVVHFGFTQTGLQTWKRSIPLNK
ncbi:MAG: GHMP kinase [Bacteroidetes Order II. Incertae sedis bacterium]|nr:GHMP kinase [Bacteroidetes Order II. bacterium]